MHGGKYVTPTPFLFSVVEMHGGKYVTVILHMGRDLGTPQNWF